jgi:hypothetical protein
MPRYACRLRGSPAESATVRARQILDAGFELLGLGHPFHALHWEEVRPLLPREAIACVDLFLPYPSAHPPGDPCPFHLDPAHPEKKRDAVKYGIETILFADQNAVPYVLVPPFRLEGTLRKDLDELPRNRRFQECLLKLQALRQPEARPRLDSFRSILSKLLDAADRYGVKLAIVPGGFIDEAPDLLETQACLREFTGGPLCVWIDTLSRSAAHDLGPSDHVLDALKEGLAGATLRDYSSRKEPVLLGEGEADWQGLRKLLLPIPHWLADPPELSAASVHASLEFLEKLAREPEPPLQPGFYLS